MIYNKVYSITMKKINMYVLISHTKNRHIITVFIHATCHRKKTIHTHKIRKVTHTHFDAL